MRLIKLLLMFALGISLFNLANTIAIPAPLFTDKEDGAPPDDVKIDSAILLIMESYPMRVSLALKGELPSPCHELVWEVVNSKDEQLIEVVTYAESAPEKLCIQVVEPFERTIPLGSFTELDFRVRLNGEEVGDM